jgi:hypothetical protein
MAHAWKACWVKALGGSNPPSSANVFPPQIRMFRAFWNGAERKTHKTHKSFGDAVVSVVPEGDWIVGQPQNWFPRDTENVRIGPEHPSWHRRAVRLTWRETIDEESAKDRVWEQVLQ